jgi:hypothetical protein
VAGRRISCAIIDPLRSGACVVRIWAMLGRGAMCVAEAGSYGSRPRVTVVRNACVRMQNGCMMRTRTLAPWHCSERAGGIHMHTSTPCWV